MKKYINIQQIIILSVLILIFGCNAESYIEGEGYLTETEAAPENGKGSITIYASRAFSCSSGLAVYIDGEARGTLREYKLSGSANCGEKSNTAVTYVLSEGYHKIEIKGNSTPFCASYVLNVTIKKGQCEIHNLS